MNSHNYDIHPLSPADADAYRAIRLRMLREHPEAFGASAGDLEREPPEVFAGKYRERVAAEGRFILGAYIASELVGTAGFFRERGAKICHKGTIWGMYVAPEARGRGIGRALLEAVVARAAKTQAGLEQILIAAAVENAAACHLYESAGFVTWGLEPAALKLGERRLDERYMVRFLETEPEGSAR
jgi:ribosomal protein S18 acetylase RimI-like enzyme